MAGTWQGGGSVLGGLAGGLWQGYKEGAGMLRQKQLDDERRQYNERAYETTKEDNRLRQQDYEARYGLNPSQGQRMPPYQGMGTPQQPDMRYNPPPPPSAQTPMTPPPPGGSPGGADMGGIFRRGADAFKQGFGSGGMKGFNSGGGYGDETEEDSQGLWDMNPDVFSTAVSGQEPPEDIRMDEQGGATGGYGGAGAMRQPMGPPIGQTGAGAMPQNIQHTQRTARMSAYEHMQARKNALMPKVKTMMTALQMHDAARDWRPGEREQLIAELQPAAEELHQLGGTAQQPEGAIEEQKGRVLRDTHLGYPGAQGEYPPMQGAAIDFLGNEAGTERHIGGAQLLRQRFPSEQVPRQSNARPQAPRFKPQRNWSQGGGYNPY